MTTLSRWVRFGLVAILLAAMPVLASAAPYAALVMDARTGEVLYSSNADTRLHPASLTKMMTLYIAFEAIEHGEISLDSMVTVSARAAGEQPSRLGLRAGQKIALRYLIRAAAIKSANDAATAIAEAIEGSVPAFATRMNRTAKALGMKNSTFKNANGLTASGHLSTARDLTLLGRRLFYDYPEYYNLFSRRSADAGMASVSNTNARFLDSYEGADGIKTGYTVAAGFNLTASAERGGKRIIATVLGGTSTPQRNARMVELLDLGFSKAPSRVREVPPAPPVYAEPAPSAPTIAQASTGAKTVRVSGAVLASPRPVLRPSSATPATAAPPEPPPTPAFAQSEPPQPETRALAAAPLPEPQPAPAAPAPALAAGPVFAQSEAPQPETVMLAEAPGALPPVVRPATGASDNLAEGAAPPAQPTPLQQAAEAPAPVVVAIAEREAPAASALALATSPRPVRAPGRTAAAASVGAQIVAPAVAIAAPAPPPLTATFAASQAPQPETLALVSAAPPPVATAPQPAPAAEAAPQTSGLILTALTPPAPAPRQMPEVVSRLSTSGGQGWGVSLGTFSTSYQAERVLLQTALMEAETLGEALRKVASRRGGFDATFVGMPQELAEMACRRLAARQTECTVIGP